ncbi:hypothetical protein [Bradyrhizobium australiense]|uniref:Uncharacterized protein n=1 Tax=Bradyrhizobium australiense TaxID=2721161 RepID=A0A7Y4GW75_9BRAD|nr:hypothetical protein [Bradyrhizobium australiense]NOJ43016.1 hypothetical protein [Bradyrhizobium australiense]
MKITLEAHMKIASMILRAAGAATGTKKLRLESLAHAPRSGKQSQAKLKGILSDASNAVNRESK